MLQVTSSILIMNSAGSVLGPLLVAPVVVYYGGAGFFLFAAVCMTVGASLAAYRIRHVERPEQHENRFQVLPKTSAIVAELAANESAVAPHPAAAAPGAAGHYPRADVPMRKRA